MRSTGERIAGWLLTSGVVAVVAAGLGCGTAWAGPEGENSYGSKSSSSDSRGTEPSNDTPDLESESAQRRNDPADDSRGRRLSEGPGVKTPLRERRTTATVKDNPTERTSSAITGQPRDAVSVRTNVAGYDGEPGKFATAVPERSTVVARESANTLLPIAPVERAEQSAIITGPTTSPSPRTGEDSSVVELTITPQRESAIETLVDIAQREGIVTPSITAADAAAEIDAAPAVYTGQPSFIQQVVVLALRVVNTALSPFGGILSLTGLKVPIFADGVPPFFVTGGLNVKQDSIAGMPVYVLSPPAPTGATVIALHGGAYAAEASIFHWETYADMARKTGATVIVPDYPLIGEPGGTADVVVPQTAELISTVIATRGAENTYVIGDSAGGGLALAAVQLLVASGAATPRRMVLLAPWLDATVSDPESELIVDPLLNVSTLRRDGELWAGHLDPTHPWASPINGSLDGLPPITVYSGSLDLLSPQALRLRERAMAEGADITFELRNGLMHDYPIFFFLPDALDERPSIYRALLGSTSPLEPTA